MSVKIKICGITEPEEVAFLKHKNIRYAGLVMFYERSKRSHTSETAGPVLSAIGQIKKEGAELKSVAVTVSPTRAQIDVIENLGFDILQIHGEISQKLLAEIKIPVFLACNISDKTGEILNQNLINDKKIIGVLLDGKNPGGGKTFDWENWKSFDRTGKLLILAGGLNEENVKTGIRILNPDIVDVSSGVEYTGTEKRGKDPVKINQFVQAVEIQENGGKNE